MIMLLPLFQITSFIINLAIRNFFATHTGIMIEIIGS